MRKLIKLKIKDWQDAGDYQAFSMLTIGKGNDNLSIMLHIEGEILAAYGTEENLKSYSDRLKKMPVGHEFIYLE